MRQALGIMINWTLEQPHTTLLGPVAMSNADTCDIREGKKNPTTVPDEGGANRLLQGSRTALFQRLVLYQRVRVFLSNHIGPAVSSAQSPKHSPYKSLLHGIRWAHAAAERRLCNLGSVFFLLLFPLKKKESKRRGEQHATCSQDPGTLLVVFEESKVTVKRNRKRAEIERCATKLTLQGSSVNHELLRYPSSAKSERIKTDRLVNRLDVVDGGEEK
ncbi:uncharacterized protein MCYG_06491 [Microsporum canis CBS 113480]|uniref:Uncharacterized protein n=1 Tax=Arthroderma otae (strain ATCC MYA-4605 / CBS 113480) TaxID=554155 RepID=C5FUT8_ARTOC|nr:uncharacterized protein MCYG_06491 [Microsporum canis CBS 113480]EEQ33672.1 predicted protein [Microsporum canis CBS 113480]